MKGRYSFLARLHPLKDNPNTVSNSPKHLDEINTDRIDLSDGPKVDVTEKLEQPNNPKVIVFELKQKKTLIQLWNLAKPGLCQAKIWNKNEQRNPWGKDEENHEKTFEGTHVFSFEGGFWSQLREANNEYGTCSQVFKKTIDSGSYHGPCSWSNQKNDHINSQIDNRPDSKPYFFGVCMNSVIFGKILLKP